MGRRGWDSNPRDACNAHSFSRRAPSTTRTPLPGAAHARAPATRTDFQVYPKAGTAGQVAASVLVGVTERKRWRLAFVPAPLSQLGEELHQLRLRFLVQHAP